MPKLRIQVRGQFTCWLDDQPVPIRARHAMALLARLALESPHALDRADIRDWLWGTTEPTKGDVSLRQLLSKLRKELPALIVTDTRVSLTAFALEVVEGEGEFLPECEDEWTKSKRLGRQTKSATAPLIQLLEWYEGKDPNRAAQILSDAWEIAMMLDPGQLRYMAERFAGDGLPPGARVRLDFLRGYAAFINTDYGLAQARLRDVIRQAFLLDEVPVALVAGQWLSLSEMETLDYDRADRTTSWVWSRASQMGDMASQGRAAHIRALIQWHSFQFRDALTTFDFATPLLEESGAHYELAHARVNHCVLAVRTPDWDTYERVRALALKNLDELGDWRMPHVLNYADALAHLFAGDKDTALELMIRSQRSTRGMPSMEVWAREGIAEAFHALGEQAQARENLERARALRVKHRYRIAPWERSRVHKLREASRPNENRSV